MKYWLFKSEPNTFSFQDLERMKSSFWDGVRNYQARNFMMNDMELGDQVLFYHSNTPPIGICGTCKVIETAKPDLSSLDSKSPYFDEKATPENPRWFAVTVGNPKKFNRFVTLDGMRLDPILKDMLLLKKGQRLSIQPVSKVHFEHIVSLGSE
jgi:predicted RNA-binding protein with PUA-like domain